MYYDASWRLIEEHIKDRVGIACPDGCTTRIAQQFWGDRYIDDAVARRMKTYNAQNPNYQEFWPENMWWYVTDAQFSVAALLDTRANLVERLVYDPYGKAMHIRQTDVNYDGVVDNEDFTIQEGVPLYTKIDDNNYHPDVDFQRSGIYDSSNRNNFLWAYYANGRNGGAVDDGEITETNPYVIWPSSLRVNPLAPDNPIGYCGYVYNPETQDYTVRFRHYSPRLGRWLERDPAGYVDGGNLYAQYHGTSTTDPYGLFCETPVSKDEMIKRIQRLITSEETEGCGHIEQCNLLWLIAILKAIQAPANDLADQLLGNITGVIDNIKSTVDKAGEVLDPSLVDKLKGQLGSTAEDPEVQDLIREMEQIEEEFKSDVMKECKKRLSELQSKIFERLKGIQSKLSKIINKYKIGEISEFLTALQRLRGPNGNGPTDSDILRLIAQIFDNTSGKVPAGITQMFTFYSQSLGKIANKLDEIAVKLGQANFCGLVTSGYDMYTDDFLGRSWAEKILGSDDPDITAAKNCDSGKSCSTE